MWLCQVCTSPNYEGTRCLACGFDSQPVEEQEEVKFGVGEEAQFGAPVAEEKLARPTFGSSFENVSADAPITFGIEPTIAPSPLPMPTDEARVSFAPGPSSTLFGEAPSDIGVTPHSSAPTPVAGFCKAMTTPTKSAQTLLGFDENALPSQQEVQPMNTQPGEVMTWGSGDCQQLAIRSDLCDEFGNLPKPASIKAFVTQGADMIACGSLTSYAVRKAVTDTGATVSELWSWGCCDNGPLGRPVKQVNDQDPCWAHLPSHHITSAKAPARVWGLPENETILKVVAGDSHAAVVTDAGDCYVWGHYRDYYGPLGFWDFETQQLKDVQLTPAKLPLSVGMVALDIASGDNHTIILTENNDKRYLMVMGSSEFGQLFTPPLADEASREERARYLRPVVLALDDLRFQKFECIDAISKNNTFKNIALDLSVTRIVRVFAGNATSFIKVLSSNVTYIFAAGRGCYGELGGGYTSPVMYRPTLLCVPSLCHVEDIVGGDFVTLILASDGSVWSCGRADLAAHKSSTASIITPKAIPGLRCAVRAIAVGSKTQYAITHEGIVFAWGEGNSYQFGNGKDEDDVVCVPTYIPRENFAYKWVLAMAAGSTHACAICVEPQKRGLKRARNDDWDELPSVAKRSRPDQPSPASGNPEEKRADKTPTFAHEGPVDIKERLVPAAAPQLTPVLEESESVTLPTIDRSLPQFGTDDVTMNSSEDQRVEDDSVDVEMTVVSQRPPSPEETPMAETESPLEAAPSADASASAEMSGEVSEPTPTPEIRPSAEAASPPESGAKVESATEEDTAMTEQPPAAKEEHAKPKARAARGKRGARAEKPKATPLATPEVSLRPRDSLTQVILSGDERPFDHTPQAANNETEPRAESSSSDELLREKVAEEMREEEAMAAEEVVVEKAKPKAKAKAKGKSKAKAKAKGRAGRPARPKPTEDSSDDVEPAPTRRGRAKIDEDESVSSNEVAPPPIRTRSVRAKAKARVNRG